MTRISPWCGSRSVTWTSLLTLSLRRTLEKMESTPALSCTLDAFDYAVRPRYEQLRTGGIAGRHIAGESGRQRETCGVRPLSA